LNVDLPVAANVGIVVGVVLLLLFLGTEVFAALAIGGVAGILLSEIGIQGLAELGGTAWFSTANFILVALPAFIFMSAILARCGLDAGLFSSLSKWIGRIPGSLAVVCVAFCTVFAAISGSSTATAAAVGTIAVPQMEERHYDRRYVLGTLAAGGTLGILIPPSLSMILYGYMTGTSVGKLFIAGVIPGVVLAGSFAAYVYIKARMTPSVAPLDPERATWRQRFMSLLWMAPFLALITVVLGGIYMGIMTPTEAGAIGGFAAIILTIAYRRFTFRALWEACWDTARISSMLLLIMVGGLIMARALTRLGFGQSIVDAIDESGMSPWMIVAMISVVYIIMGCLMDSMTMMIITLPFFAPVLNAAGIDMIWFGVYLVVLIEMGLLTPPVGINLFVIHGLAPGRFAFRDVAMGALPFILIMVLALIALGVFPQIATWLPDLMSN
jgi:tripartite ATP-independent transporter DctM subunit